MICFQEFTRVVSVGIKYLGRSLGCVEGISFNLCSRWQLLPMLCQSFEDL
jgi:hypothetical protein